MFALLFSPNQSNKHIYFPNRSNRYLNIAWSIDKIRLFRLLKPIKTEHGKKYRQNSTNVVHTVSRRKGRKSYCEENDAIYYQMHSEISWNEIVIKSDCVGTLSQKSKVKSDQLRRGLPAAMFDYQFVWFYSIFLIIWLVVLSRKKAATECSWLSNHFSAHFVMPSGVSNWYK